MPKKWEKVLYKKQNVPDSYVDASFLSDLRKNVNLYKYSWREAFVGVSAVTHEVTCTVLFVVTFVHLKEETYSISTVIATVALLILLSSLLQQWRAKNWWMLDASGLYQHAKSCVIFLTFGYMFSPVLKTLTETISTDTIYAMVVLMMLFHVLFQDYGADAAIVSSSLSLNSALFAAVCLASRLPTVQHTFALVVLAVKVFVLLPLLRKELKKDTQLLLVITGTYFVIVLTALVYISIVYTILFACLCICLNFVFPIIFIRSQKYKETIFGPWDEAVVKMQ